MFGALLLAFVVIFVTPNSYSKDQVSALGQTALLSKQALHFEYGTQDGEITMPCTFEMSLKTYDFHLICGEEGKFGGPKRFTVHLRLKRYPAPTPPKLRYELLYWVIDHQTPVTENGRYAETTLWFRLQEPSDLHSLSVAQTIQDVHELRMDINLSQIQSFENSPPH